MPYINEESTTTTLLRRFLGRMPAFVPETARHYQETINDMEYLALAWFVV